MKRTKYRSISAAILSVLLILAVLAPGQSSSGNDQEMVPETEEVTEKTEQTETEGILAGAAGVSQTDMKKAVSSMTQALQGSYETSVEIMVERPLQDTLSGLLKNTDMSWLNTVSISGASAGNDDGGLDASGVLTVNGTKLYSGKASLDMDEGKIYLCCPEFRKTAFCLDLSELASGAGESAKKAAEKASAKSGITQKDITHLAGEAQELFASIPEKEWSSFAGRYAMTLVSNIDMSHHDNVTVTAGGLSEQVENTTITIEPKAMANMLQSAASMLSEDELVLKILQSDFAVDLGNLILKQGKEDPEELSGDELVENFRNFLASPDLADLKMPGFSFTYAYDGEGRICDAALTIIYSGIQASLFSWQRVIVGSRHAMELNLGPLFSAYIAPKNGGDADGNTGILFSGTSENGKLNETVTVSAAGQELSVVQIADLDTGKLSQGILEGSISADIGGAVYTAEFTHPEDNAEQIRGLYNDTLYLTILASASQTKGAKVEKISRSKAKTIASQSDWYAYVKDSSLSKMIGMLSDVGVPDSIVESLSSGEAGTESSRENKTEQDGQPGELENGEVGGADIGSLKNGADDGTQEADSADSGKAA